MTIVRKLFTHGVALLFSTPSWALTLEPNEWTALPVFNNHEDVQAANSGQYADAGPDSVLDAWSGGVLVPSWGTSGGIFYCAGGHKNYYGNEVYVFDLALLRWFRLTSPSVEADWAGPFPNGILNDGKPNAAVHTYYYNFHRNGRYVIVKRQVTNAPTSFYGVTEFDPRTLEWTSSLVEPSTLAPTNDEGACYDPDRDVAWMVEANPLQWARYNWSSDSWTTFTQPTGALQPQCGPFYCNGPQAVLQFVDNAVWGLDPTEPEHDKYALSTTGTGPTRGVGDMMRWSRNLGCGLYYPSKGNSIYRFIPPVGDWRSGTWTWSQLSLTGTTGTHTGQGTYGKFDIAEWGTRTVALICGGPAQAYRACDLVV